MRITASSADPDSRVDASRSKNIAVPVWALQIIDREEMCGVGNRSGGSTERNAKGRTNLTGFFSFLIIKALCPSHPPPTVPPPRQASPCCVPDAAAWLRPETGDISREPAPLSIIVLRPERTPPAPVFPRSPVRRAFLLRNRSGRRIWFAAGSDTGGQSIGHDLLTKPVFTRQSLVRAASSPLAIRSNSSSLVMCRHRPSLCGDGLGDWPDGRYRKADRGVRRRLTA